MSYRSRVLLIIDIYLTTMILTDVGDSVVLRLYPQVPMNTRSTVKTTLLPKGRGPDGEAPDLVPRKAGITFSPYHMHRRKELFGADANEFRPERWLDGSLSNIGYAYMPFLHGYRTCLGSTSYPVELQSLVAANEELANIV